MKIVELVGQLAAAGLDAILVVIAIVAGTAVYEAHGAGPWFWVIVAICAICAVTCILHLVTFYILLQRPDNKERPNAHVS